MNFQRSGCSHIAIFLISVFLLSIPIRAPIGQFKDWAVWVERRVVLKVLMILVKSLEAPPRPAKIPALLLLDLMVRYD